MDEFQLLVLMILGFRNSVRFVEQLRADRAMIQDFDDSPQISPAKDPSVISIVIRSMTRKDSFQLKVSVVCFSEYKFL